MQRDQVDPFTVIFHRIYLHKWFIGAGKQAFLQQHLRAHDPLQLQHTALSKSGAPVSISVMTESEMCKSGFKFSKPNAEDLCLIYITSTIYVLRKIP